MKAIFLKLEKQTQNFYLWDQHPLIKPKKLNESTFPKTRKANSK
jgi:hypothetical protein